MELHGPVPATAAATSRALRMEEEEHGGGRIACCIAAKLVGVLTRRAACGTDCARHGGGQVEYVEAPARRGSGLPARPRSERRGHTRTRGCAVAVSRRAGGRRLVVCAFVCVRSGACARYSSLSC